jgi:UDP-glucose 4-epimerase
MLNSKPVFGYYVMHDIRVQFEKALVTGGAGFIGSNLTRQLVSQRIPTVVLDNLSSGFRHNVPSSARFRKGDVRNRSDVRLAAKGADIIFHLAEYIPNIVGHVIKSSKETPIQDLDICVGGTINALEEARRNDSRFILASTAAVYGSGSSPLSEHTSPAPQSPYGVSKLAAEEYTLLYRRMYGLPVTIFRFFNVYGPGQKKYLMYDILAKAQKNPQNLKLLGTGEEKRDFVFIGDALEEVFSVITAKPSDEHPVYNIGTGVGYSTRQIAQEVRRISHLNFEFTFSGTSFLGTSMSLVANITKTSQYFVQDFTSLENGIAALVSWFRGLSEN